MNQSSQTSRPSFGSALRAWIARNRRRVVFLGAVLILGLVSLYLMQLEPPVSEENLDPERVRTVTVIEAVAGTHAAEVVGFAEVRPRWSSSLRAQVSGTLLSVDQGFQPGAQVQAGHILAEIDSTAWVAEWAAAENRLQLAELTLLREQEEADEARRSWRESGFTGEPDSRLVLREPQIEAARSERDAAKAALDWATRQLTFTRIQAPFNGVVTQRHVSRGEAILQGEVVAQIYATDAFELEVPIPENQWRELPDPVIGVSADVVAAEGSGRWQATIVRQGAAIDPATRMRTLYLTVVNPLMADTPLWPGTFVEVYVQGRAIDGLLELPEGVLTRKGYVWYVDDAEQLNRFEATPQFTREGRVYIAEPEVRAAWRIVRYPLESYLVGQKVQPEQVDLMAVEGR